MLAHGLDHDFRGDLEILLREAALEHGRVFDEIGHIFEQLIVVQLAPVRVQLGLEQFAGHALALIDQRDHFTLSKQIDVRVEVGCGEFDTARAQERMPVCRAAGLDPGQFEVDHIAVEQRDQRPDRPSEPDRVRMPAHGLGERQAGDDIGQGLCQDVRCRLPLDPLSHRAVLALRRVLEVDIGQVDTLRLGEAGPGFGGFAILAEGNTSRRAGDFRLNVFLALDQALREHGQPAWRGRALHLDVTETGFRRQRADSLTECVERRLDVARGQFLGADFE